MSSTYSSLYAHIVFSTKHRVPMIGAEWTPQLHAYLGGVVRRQKATAVCVGGVADHVHLLIAYRTDLALANLVREIKKASNSFASEHARNFEWQVGYGAFSVSPRDVEMIRTYIIRQPEHHKTISSADELRQLLEDAGITYDERYFE